MRDLPRGWGSVPLGRLSTPTRPRKDPKTLPALPYVGMEHIESNTRRLVGNGSSAQMKSSAFHFKPGDVLYGRLRPYLNKVLCAKFEGLCSTEFIVLPPSPLFEPQFLALYLSTEGFVSFANQLNQGDRPRVSFDQIAHHVVPLPPINEQRRIVAKVAELFAKVEACENRLAKIPVILKRFRRSVVAAACSGKVTADWRDSQLNELSVAGFLKQVNPNFEAIEPGTLRVEDFPPEWIVTRFGEVVQSIRGGSTAVPTNERTEFPILRSSSVRPGSVDLEDVKYVSEDESRNELNYLACGDLLFTRLSGSLDYVANCAKVTDLNGRRIQYPDRLFCAKVVDGMEPSYFELVFEAPFVREAITEQAKSSAGHQRVSIGDITAQPIPIPPTEEQREVVRRVHGLFRLADQIEARCKASQAQLEKLTQSILTKVFRGELVPTEDELMRRRVDRGVSSLNK
jgi:type I restriction enzyme, S subunit